MKKPVLNESLAKPAMKPNEPKEGGRITPPSRINRQQVELVKPFIPVGCCIDIANGSFEKGAYGQYILNGGLPQFSAVIGTPNQLKSTLIDDLILTAIARMRHVYASSLGVHDTEGTVMPSRLATMGNKHDEFGDDDLLKDGTIVVTDNNTHTALEFVQLFKDDATQKKANLKEYMVQIPFLDRDGKQMVVPLPNFTFLDSVTELVPDPIMKALQDLPMGDPARNMLPARSAGIKKAIIQEMGRSAYATGDFISMSAHVTRSMEVNAGPFAPQREVVLTDVKNGDTIIGASKSMSFLAIIIWQTMGLAPANNNGGDGKGFKQPLYPADAADAERDNIDQRFLIVKTVRAKQGPTSGAIKMVVSQSKGINGPLTEFHNCREQKRFGLTGAASAAIYSMVLYPDMKISRTTIQAKLAASAALRRAVNITSELRQMIQLMPKWDKYYCTPEELYQGIIDQGYSWDFILNKTRGYWVYSPDTHPLKEISTLDLLRMRVGEYEPYWIKDAPDVRTKQ
jgi:hypothetical protein